jgi:membrane protease YdiL (CAAX protease family)
MASSVPAGVRGASGRERRWPAFVELTAVVALAIADLYGLVPVTKTLFIFVLAWISLRRRGLGWREVGLVKPVRWGAGLLIGCCAGAAMEVFSTFVSVPLLSRCLGQPPSLADFRPLVGNLRLVLILLVPLWLGSALEELVYRGYLMGRVAGIGGGSRVSWVVSLLLVSAFFGWGHEGQDVTGMLQEGFAGLLLGLIYLGCGRTLYVPCVAHAVSNTVAFLLIYLDRYPGV